MRTVIDCDSSRAAAILDILNDAIVNSTALYDYRPRTLAGMDAWFDAKRQGRYPIIGMVDEADRLLGFASYGPFRPWPAYKYSIEHSVYVHPDHRGQGVGKQLLASIIEKAREQQYHNIVAGIDRDNTVSIALHERFGFEPCGTVRQAGFKFGRWLDLAFYQLLLETPVSPVDG